MSVASPARGDALEEAHRSLPGTLQSLRGMVLLPVGLILWAFGLTMTHTGSLGPYGLLGSLSPVSYAGILAVLVSAGLQFARPATSGLRLGAHAVSLVVILFGTAPLVYSAGRYAWLYKTVGVTQYVNAHGALDPTIDIYQHWAAFFAAAAWFDKLTGSGNPLTYAKWAQVAFQLAAIPLLYVIYQALGMPVWHRWLAIMLYATGNWIAQDYYSPQALSTVLSLGILAIGVRWLGRFDPGDTDRRSPPWVWIGIMLFLTFVLTVTHELSPYIVTLQLLGLSVMKYARPRWVVLAMGVIVAAFLAPNFGYVNQHYGLLASLGNFFNNVQPPSDSSGVVAIPLSHRIISDSSRLLSAFIWMLALVGAWRIRKSRRLAFGLIIMTFSPILVLAAGAYGNEGVMRVVLFSLPWAVSLAACAIAPFRPDDPDDINYPDNYVPAKRGGRRVDALLATAALTITAALFLPAFYGDDPSNVIPQSQVDTLLTFQQRFTAGPVLVPIANAALSDTAGYNYWPIVTIFGTSGLLDSKHKPGPDIATFLARSMIYYTRANVPTYLVITQTMTTFNDAYGVMPTQYLTLLSTEVAKSKYWTPVLSTPGTVVYRLSDAALKIPAGPSSSAVQMAVP
jgi:hypothetical protein